jgi:XTP/dITP diphosphohydrolase
VKILLATRNPGKLREVRNLLSPKGIQVESLSEFEIPVEIVEDGATFLENARKKAWAIAEAAGLPVLADDSGLVVRAVGGHPGVRSARYAGPGASDAENNRKVLDALRGQPAARRRASFVCAMVLAVPGRGEFTSEGRLDGEILEAPRGAGGFGYDPIFAVGPDGRTLAEMSVEEKNRISHRSIALRALLPTILELGREEGA